MKRLQYFMIILVSVVFSCTPEELPLDVIDVQSPFETTVSINGLNESFSPRDYTMVTGWGEDRMFEDALSFWGMYSATDCVDSCGAELSFEFYDVENRSGDQIDPLEVLKTGRKEFAPISIESNSETALVWDDFSGVIPEDFCIELIDPVFQEVVEVVCGVDRSIFNNEELIPGNFNVQYEDGTFVGSISESPFLSFYNEAPSISFEGLEDDQVQVSLDADESKYDIYYNINDDILEGNTVVMNGNTVEPFAFQLIDKNTGFPTITLVVFVLPSMDFQDRRFVFPYLEEVPLEFDFSKVADKVRIVLTEGSNQYMSGAEIIGDEFYFDIKSIEPYLDNESGDPTFLIHADIRSILFDVDNGIPAFIDAADVPFAVAFPK